MKLRVPIRFGGKSFRNFFVSYIIILAMLLCANFAYYRRTYDMLREEGVDASATRVMQFSAVMDNEIETMMGTLVALEKSYYFTQCLVDDTRAAIDRYMLYNLRAQMKLAMSSKTLDLFVYFVNSDLIVSSFNPTAASRIYYRAYYGSGADSYEDWARLLSADKYASCGVAYSAGMPCLVITHALPTSARNACHAVAVGILRPQTLSAFMQNTVASQGAVAVYDASGARLISSDDAVAPAALPASLSETGYATVTLGGVSYYAHAQASQSSNCVWATFVPVSAYTGRTRALFRLQMSFSVGLIVAGIAIAYLLTRRNLRPLRRIVENVAMNADQKWLGRYEDEYDYLHDTITAAVSEKRVLQQEYSRNMRSIQENFLFKAIHGGLDGESDLRAEFAQNRLTYLSDRFAVLVIRHAGVDSDFEEIDDTLKSIARMHKCLCHVLHVTLPDVTAIINAPADASNDALDALCASVKGSMEKLSFVARSDLFAGPSALADAWRQVVRVREYVVVYGHSRVLTPDLLLGGDSFRFNRRFFAEAETQLIAAVRGDELDYEDAQDLYDRLRASYCEDGVTTPDSARCFAYDLRNIAMNVVGDLCSPAVAASIWNGGETSFHFVNLFQFGNAFMDGLLGAHKQYHTTATAGDDISGRVEAYLEAHYSEAGLGVATLGEAFGLSGAYLSGRYREQVGRSVTDRLAEIRVLHVCELLEGTDLPLEQIASEVGLLNSQTLIRIFKKQKGVTPGTWRKLNRKP